MTVSVQEAPSKDMSNLYSEIGERIVDELKDHDHGEVVIGAIFNKLREQNGLSCLVPLLPQIVDLWINDWLVAWRRSSIPSNRSLRRSKVRMDLSHILTNCSHLATVGFFCA
jgi:hypothetical protein